MEWTAVMVQQASYRSGGKIVPSQEPNGSFLVKVFRNIKGVWVDFRDGMQLILDLFDTGNVGLVCERKMV